MGEQVSSEHPIKFYAIEHVKILTVAVRLTNMDCGYKTRLTVAGLNHSLWIQGRFDEILKPDHVISIIYEKIIVHDYEQSWVYAFGPSDINTLRQKFKHNTKESVLRDGEDYIFN